jgi:hypothetical protein
VISSTAARHDPAGFLTSVGAAYRASGRTRPILDVFGHNPYPNDASESPSATHPDGSGTVGEGDLRLLLSAADTAFDGTGQPVPGTGGTTIWYLEDGFQTTIPPQLRHLYTGTENDANRVPALNEPGSAATPDQATQLRNALLLAYCQPGVGAFFNFGLIDESRLSGWQSGLLWRNGTPKPSYEPFKQAIAQIAAGQVDCTAVPGAPS